MPGEARWYATAVTFAGYAQPVLGKTFAGRPVKLEGNPDHPASRGRTDAFTQAALLSLYDPGRSQIPRRLGKPVAWDAFDTAMAQHARELDAVQGEGFRLLTGPTSSPTLLRQIAALMERWPRARWHVCDPVPTDGLTAATERLFGRPQDIRPAFDKAEVIVAFDDDFLAAGPFQTRNAGLFADRRRMRQRGEGISRLLVTEPVLSITGSTADSRIVASPEEVSGLLQGLGAELGIGTVPAGRPGNEVWLREAVAALRAAGGRSLVLVGPYHPPGLQALALSINERLGNFGSSLLFSDPVVSAPPDGARSLAVLAEDMNAGRVTTLAVLGTNPVHAAPGDLDFAEAMEKVGLCIHAGLYTDETAALCHWHVPQQHDLESWSDARAVDGSVVLTQPLVTPFFSVRSPHVVLENLLGRQAVDHELVQTTWRQAWGGDFEGRWPASLDKGVVEGSALPLSAPPVVNRDIDVPPPAARQGTSLYIRPDVGVWDGSLSDNAWAQETPRPISKITWGNVVGVSPQLAGRQGLANGDEVRVSAGDNSITGAVWIMPGQAPETISLTLGYGRTAQGSIAAGLGYNPNVLRRVDALWHVPAVEIEKTGGKQLVATTQAHQAMDGFDFVRTVDASDVTVVSGEEPPSFYPTRPMEDPSWGMSIDLDLCIGCNACVTACQAENNVPVVGKEQVAKGREMHWLRVDHYFEGEPEAPKSYHQPVPCMHCEQAPCEMGCPVNATSHSTDGLNLQVYNRCIGTRTCSSYCPYKVRRFNWFDFTGDDPPSIQAMRNPDVTVRSRGVMEKCTYCVQRIAEAKITAGKENRPIRDGEVVTACQQACPTQAIIFGNVADSSSAVSRRKADARDYALLEEVNTRPRTTYLARIRQGAQAGEEDG